MTDFVNLGGDVLPSRLAVDSGGRVLVMGREGKKSHWNACLALSDSLIVSLLVIGQELAYHGNVARRLLTKTALNRRARLL